ncbi:hypothetical protein KIJ96_09395 [Pseudoalteromonas piscicida]|uniref:hypothetical protein n=1 Tax=Pseudoalteromonas piscicida TaxID=43662 RepID=UPI001D0BBE6D|nr:hypothetical protein [Pseudoalteromonas piscicida]UDM60080.1 hypothetical protein KIJ96_09395 [Pseudoalteromonas piscicida]
MFAEIIKNMYGISLYEFAVMALDAIMYLVAVIVVLSAFIKLEKITKSKYVKGVKLSLVASILSSFVAAAVAENSDAFGILEVFVLLIPSVFILLSAVCFYRFSKEVIVKYS